MSDKKQGISKKQIFTMAVAMVLVAVISVGATLAYLNVTTTTKHNIFTGSEGIGLDIDEPSYDPDKSNGYTPGTVFAKDPILKNTTADANTSEWVAMKVTYCSYESTSQTSTPITYTEMQKYIKPIVFDDDASTGKWKKIAGGEDSDKYVIYMYKTAVAGQAETGPLFEQIEIWSQSELQTKWGSTTDFLMDFDIQVAGAAIKNEQSVTTFSSVAAAEQANIENALIALFPATN